MKILLSTKNCFDRIKAFFSYFFLIIYLSAISPLIIAYTCRLEKWCYIIIIY